MPTGLNGKLLVATPELIDPNFRRTVVLMIEHEPEEGAMGVVLNRPTEIGVLDALTDWADLAAEPGVVFAGGPVGPEVGIGLVDTPGRPEEDWSPVLDDVGPADLGGVPEDIGGVRRCRIYAGYAGWSPGQLEMELDEPAWFVVDAVAGDIFTRDPETLWRRVLGRQPGVLSWYANYPEHPRLN